MEGDLQTYLHPQTGQPLKVRYEFEYRALPTVRLFHSCRDEIRCLVGPVGSGKTAGATIEVGYRIPMMYWNRYGINKTRGVILRNTYPMLVDSTQRTFFEWFPPGLYGRYNKNDKNYNMVYTTMDKQMKPVTLEVEILFRSCDDPKLVEQFRGFELTWYYIDESDEVHENVKKMLKQRIGRFPKQQDWFRVLTKMYPALKGMDKESFHEELRANSEKYQTAFGIETTNPPSTESSTYSTFSWHTPPPGPKPEKAPLVGHKGFWQPPYENSQNLRPGYYDRLREMWANSPDWVARYIDGKPGVTLRGKSVYNNFHRKTHEALTSLVWTHGPLFRGWDNTGHHPGCVVCQMPTPRQIQIIKEFYSERENIVSFAKRVVAQCNVAFPNGEYTDWADPAGWQKISKRDGTFTSNSEMMEEECGLVLERSEQNFDARVNAVDQQLMEMVGGGEPALLIDPDCVRTINGFMGAYYYPETAGLPGRFGDQPVKNGYADVHDAIQYVVVKLRDSSPGSTIRSRDFGRPDDPLLMS